MAEYADLIGTPYKLGGRGPETFDCYGLLMELMQRDGFTIPDYRTPPDAESESAEAKQRLAAISGLMSQELRLWQETKPHRGAALLFSIRGYGAHCGYLIAPDWFLHTWEGTGSVAKERLSAGWKNRLLGYYDYVG